MMLYRKRPVVVEAEQWDGTVSSATKIIDWILANDGTARYLDALPAGEHFAAASAWIAIDTLEGVMKASTGDFIIRGIQNEFYPCKPDIFVGTYEKV